MKIFLDKKRRTQILGSFEIQKAYTEGVYADTPANRKLGRVGMKYSSFKEDKKEEDKSLFHNEQKLDESLSKISRLVRQKMIFKEDKGVWELLNNDIQREKDKIEKICPNYNRAYKYVKQILDTDDGNKGKEINVPKDCVESIQFLLKFEGLSSSEYKLNKTEKGYYISLI